MTGVSAGEALAGVTARIVRALVPTFPSVVG